MAWKLYTDAACTAAFSGTLALEHYNDLSDNPQDTLLYYAEVEDDTGDAGAYKQEAQSNPGVDDIVLSAVDANVGSGHEASEITLAATAGALATNTAGADLILGTQLLSGVSNRQEAHVRVENAVVVLLNSTELSVDINPTVDSAV